MSLCSRLILWSQSHRTDPWFLSLSSSFSVDQTLKKCSELMYGRNKLNGTDKDLGRERERERERPQKKRSVQGLNQIIMKVRLRAYKKRERENKKKFEKH